MGKLRVLCLHSWRTSGDIFQAQWKRSGLDAALADLVELVFITAPNSASGPIPEDVAGTFEGPYFEWFSTDKVKDGQELVFTFHNIHVSEAAIMQAMREKGPFDGICGFSQGGAMASIVAALQATGLALTDVQPLKFALFFGAVPNNHPRYLPAFRDRVPLPSCHIIGHKDYVKEHAIRLAGAFDSPVVIMHNRGHVVPPLHNPNLAALRAFLQSIRSEGCPKYYTAKQHAQLAAVQEPLDPPSPLWEAEAAEQVEKPQEQTQQLGQGHHQQQGKRHQQRQHLPQPVVTGSQVDVPVVGQFTQVLKLGGKIGHTPQLASKL